MMKGLGKYRAPTNGSGNPTDASILAVVPEGVDRTVLEAISRDAGWELTFGDALPATGIGFEGLPPIVLYDCRVPDREWNGTVRMLSRSPSRPCVILISPRCDRNLWDELERAGGSDILRSPIQADEARRAVKRAWLLWQSQRHVRLRA